MNKPIIDIDLVPSMYRFLLKEASGWYNFSFPDGALLEGRKVVACFRSWNFMYVFCEPLDTDFYVEPCLDKDGEEMSLTSCMSRPMIDAFFALYCGKITKRKKYLIYPYSTLYFGSLFHFDNPSTKHGS